MGLVVLVLTVAGCAAPAVPPGSEGPAPVAPASPNRTLVMIARGEPPSLAAKPLVSAGAVGAIVPLFNATLDFVDEGGIPHPYLAEALPQLHTDTWRVLPDGRMETTYRLRPNLVWHDGTPLSAEHFVFAWQVYGTPALGARTLPISQMEQVSSPEARTLVIRWERPYPDAGVLRELFQALPPHILERAFQEGDAQAFTNYPYWTHEYVGLGPYRLTRWAQGALIEAVAFGAHSLGAPRIERVHITFMADANVAAATLLSGDAHIVVDSVLQYQQAEVLQREWAATQAGIVLMSPIQYRLDQIQLRPEVTPRPLLDVRVRRALAHAIDKQGLNAALFGGQAVVSPTITSPLTAYHPAVAQAITVYAYDLRRAQQLLDEAGLARRADGLYVGSTGEPFPLTVRYTAAPTAAAENTIIVEGFRRIGIEAVAEVEAVSLARDSQAHALFSAIFTTGATGGERELGTYVTTAIPRADNRWSGGNRGAWSSAVYDAAWDAFNSTLDGGDRAQQIVLMEKALSEEVPIIPHYYLPNVMAHVTALVGPVIRTTRDAVQIVHVHRWYWQQ
jgi:peptide/nickel transport system substrate-binding protein